MTYLDDLEETMDWVPTDACTLPTSEQPLRVAEFDELFTSSVREVRSLAPERLWLALSGAADLRQTVQDLVDRETSCCSFFRFDVRSSAPGVVELTVEVPAARSEVLDGLAQRARVARDGLRVVTAGREEEPAR